MTGCLRRCTAGAVLLLVSAGAVRAGVKEVEVTPDPPGDEVQVFTVRFAPSETVTYDHVTFECLLRQVITLPTPDGGTREKVHEPIWFKYRENETKFTADLDKYISFRVPVNTETLRRTFGRKIFRPDSEVTVSRMVITAYFGGEKAWVIKLDKWGKLPVDPKLIKRR